MKEYTTHRATMASALAARTMQLARLEECHWRVDYVACTNAEPPVVRRRPFLP